MNTIDWLTRLLDPPAGFAVMPLWDWCGNLWDDEIVRQLRSFRDQGCLRVMIYPSSGIMGIRFMSDDWLDKVEYAVEEAARLGMEIFIYDELDWPSGVAGGKVTEAHEFAQKVVAFVPLKRGELYQSKRGERVWKALALHRQGEAIDLSSVYEINAAWDPARHLWEHVPPDHDEVILMVQRPTRDTTFFGPFLDVLNPEAVECYLNNVHRRYERRLAAHFGKTIKGFFLDEPFWSPVTLGSCSTEQNEFLPWTDRLPEYLRALGLSEIPQVFLAAAFDVGPRTRELRIRFWRALNKHYRACYWERFGTWCREHDLLLTGHGNEQSFAGQIWYGGDFGLNLRALNMPGMDMLSFLFETDDTVCLHQPKVVNAIARWNGAPRTMAEVFACMGYGVSPHDARWKTDWLMCLGINTIVPIVPRFALVERMKNVAPGSIFTTKEPTWEWTKHYVRLMDRQAYALTSGRRECPVALLYPLENAWAEYRSLVTVEHIKQHQYKEATGIPSFLRVDRGFRLLLKTLLAIPVDCDLVYAFMFGEATIRDGHLYIRDARYDLVILPPGDIIPEATYHILKAWQAQGGVVVGVDFTPAYLLTADDHLRPLEADAFPLSAQIPFDPDGPLAEQARVLEELLSRYITCDLVVTGKSYEDKLYYQHRQSGTDDLYFITNQSCQHLDLNLHFSRGAHAYQLDAESGRIYPLRTELLPSGGLALHQHFAERSSQLLALTPEPLPAEMVTKIEEYVTSPLPPAGQIIPLEGNWSFEPLQENVLPIQECTLAQRWERTDFGAHIYRATVEVGEVPRQVALAFEPYDLRGIQEVGVFRMQYTVRVNGQEAGPHQRQESFDRNHRQVETAPLLRSGTNVVELEYHFCTWLGQLYVHSLYLSGDFAVREGVVSARPPLCAPLGSWTELGFPYYSGRARYTRSLALPRGKGPVILDLGTVRESAHVLVNGQDCGTRLWPPYRFEIGGCLDVATESTLAVVVANTLANRLYPEPVESGLLGPVCLWTVQA